MDLDAALRRAQQGDLSAFEPVIRAWEGPVRAWCVAHCPPGGDADEVAQRTFVEVFRGLSGFQVGTDFRAWLFTIARFQMRAEGTRLRRLADYHQRLVPRALSDALDRRAETDSSADVRLDHLRGCMQGLDPDDRALLARRYDAAEPLDDISRATGRSVGALKKALFLLRARLSDCVRAKLAAEAP